MKDKHFRVLHICTSDTGGAGLCCLRIHKALLEQGIDSKVLTLYKTSTDVPEVYQFGRINKYGTLRGLISRGFDKLMLKAGIAINDTNKVYKIGEKYKVATSVPISVYDVSKHYLVKQADIIHLHWVSKFIDFPSFFKKVRKTFVWTLHDQNLFYGIFHIIPKQYKNNPLEIRYYSIKYNSIHNIDNLGIVFLSKLMYSQYSKNRIISKRKKTIINDPVDYTEYRPYDKQESRKALGIPLNNIVFAFVSAEINNPNKGLKVLSETLQRMNISNVYILAIGDTKGYKQLPLVHEFGPIYDSQKLSKVYSCADYFVMPSYQETFGQTPLEAMCCGTPAIVFPTGISEELITPQNGVCAKGFTSEDLEVAIRQAMATKYDGNIIRQDMINRFSPEIIAKKYISFYKEMME